MVKERRGKTQTLFIVAVSIALLHFILTSIAGHYIAGQIGSSTGAAVAKVLTESTENQSENQRSSGKEANEIYQDMKTKSEEIVSRWKIPMLLISLPIKPVIQPLLNKIKKAWIYEPVLSKKISKEQFRTRGIIIENIANALNSLTVGFLTYFLCKIISKKKRRR